MDNSTTSAMWPSFHLSSEVKQLVHRFFALIDSNSEQAGQTLANAIFTQDGLFIPANATFQGATEISQSRKGAWTTVKTRRHTILKSYVSDAHGTDIILVGNLKMEALDGTKSDLKFVARMKIEEQESGPRICQYQVVSPAPQDSRPILAAE